MANEIQTQKNGGTSESGSDYTNAAGKIHTDLTMNLRNKRNREKLPNQTNKKSEGGGKLGPGLVRGATGGRAGRGGSRGVG